MLKKLKKLHDNNNQEGGGSPGLPVSVFGCFGYETKAIYVGFGYDIGVGAGISGNILYYDLDDDRTLVSKGQMVSEDDISRIRIY